jgi:hypothetical protein
MKFIFGLAMARYFYLSAGKRSLAKNAEAVVVQRSPIPEAILGTQNRQSIVELKTGFHLGLVALTTWRTRNSPQSVSIPVTV